MKKPHYSAKDIANYFLFKAQSDNQELFSNLKIQKLVYYAQGLHLVLRNLPLFKEEIRAWKYGPVVAELYNAFKIHGVEGISPDLSFNPDSIDSKTQNFLNEIYDVFGQFSALRLMELSHTDQCWKETPRDEIISHKSMKSCLKKYIKNGKK
jgi:uncharacterized phage-associated protein